MKEMIKFHKEKIAQKICGNDIKLGKWEKIMKDRARILVIDDEESIRFTFENFLSKEGYEVVTARNYDEAISIISEKDFDCIFIDIVLEGMTGINIIQEVKKRNLTCPLIIITGNPNVNNATDAIRLGVFDYLIKPVKKDTLLHTTKMALQHKALFDEKEIYRLNFETIFRSVKDAIITVGEKLVIASINESAKSICGLSDDAIGKIYSSVTDNCSGKCVGVIEETVRKKKPVEIYTAECQHKNRPLQVVNISACPLIDKRGMFSGVVLLIRDKTRVVAMEQELRERHQFHNIVGKNWRMQRIYSLIESLVDTQTTVLLTGESGTGKEVIAEALHYLGKRSSKLMVKVNCSSLSEEVLESELFGHVKGAFTGAIRDRVGRFQMADGGTILLDEIGDISPKIQLKLLRVLQGSEIERVGDSNPVKVDVRIIAATNKNLQKKIQDGEFREDLYYRLKVVEINLPPLRDRKDDIPLLVNHFLNKLNRKLKRDIVAITSDVKKIFMNYSWPGNIRELEHTLEHAFILSAGKVIMAEHLPLHFKDFVEATPSSLIVTQDNKSQTILQALEKTAWNKTKAAHLLGINRKTLYREIKKYKIKNDE
ncbi:MAG TPA: sigma 54-interacting transcriptional regulator [Nitrospinota bacterium]|nr:sigma 54-interacting transcriptional regulator [Nitrospinota bacterium]